MRLHSRHFLAIALGLLAAAVPGRADAALNPYEGALHEHSGYSDGWAGSRPADFYAAGRGHGLDFMAGSDHSDTLGVPSSASADCLDAREPGYDPARPGCLLADPVNPADSFRKWEATGEQAQAASTPGYTGLRGFEWSSDRFGHINAYFSRNYVNAKADGGYATTRAFYDWLARPAALGGGDDALATFNHPGDKRLSTADPAYNWDDFAYVPEADDRMVGLETYNSASDFAAPGAHGGPPEGWYARALDRGWHVGAVGAEDLGHHRGDDWGGPGQAKTVMLATDRSPSALRAAMHARRFYAVARPGQRMTFTVDGAAMGSRLARAAGRRLRVSASASTTAGSTRLELVTGHGRVVATSADGRLAVTRRADPADEPWYFVRALQGAAVVAYSSPVWIESH